MLAALASAACAWMCAPAVLEPVASAAAAQIDFTPCGDTNDYACGHLTVPLDPSGASTGTITLASAASMRMRGCIHWNLLPAPAPGRSFRADRRGPR
jgi:hypothetical protein